MRRALLLALACSPSLLASDAARSARAWRVTHERAIVRELAELLAIPNVASDAPNIVRNVAAIQAFLALALFSAGQPAAALAAALSIVASQADAVDLRGYDRALREYITELGAEHPSP